MRVYAVIFRGGMGLSGVLEQAESGFEQVQIALG